MISPEQPTNAIAEIADFIGDPVAAATFPEHKIRFRNDRAAAEIGLAGLSDAEWIDHFGHFTPIPGSLPQPLALRYHGHQFRTYNPDLGDGRGFLFAQFHDRAGRLMDLGTKGSGQTPWSRFGDGRLTLKGGVREVLATEMLEALGVETSRSFSLIETGEALQRGDEPSPTRSAVLVRLSHGHIRIGSFQRLATLRLHDEMHRLTTYCLKHFYGEQPGENAPARLLEHLAKRSARLAPSYMAAGFVHGVLNTDNININAESFDYGPWRFTPNFTHNFTAAYFDHTGLYSFGRQAEAIHWNLVQLAVSLRSVGETEPLVQAIESFAPAYRAALVELMLRRLGIASCGEEPDLALVAALETALTTTQAPLDRFFFDWAGGTPRQGDYTAPEFAAFRNLIAPYKATIDLTLPYWSQPEPCSMLIEEVEAIWHPIAESDDWSLFHAKVEAIRQMAAAF